MPLRLAEEIFYKMKKMFVFLRCFTLFVFCTILGSCRWWPEVSDYECQTPEEIVEAMNTMCSGANFSLKSVESKDSEDFKYNMVYLECDDLPEETIIAGNFIGYDIGWANYGVVDDELILSLTSYDSSARMSFIPVHSILCTNYFVLKYKNEIIDYYNNILSSVIESCDYKMKINYDLILLNYETAPESFEDFISNRWKGLDISVYLNQDYDESVEATIMSFLNDCYENKVQFEHYRRFHFEFSDGKVVEYGI